ncbi:MAG: thioredoxin [Anaerolineae bacterium]|nr:thioredoxin [Anaerolineae bacterium]
MSKPVAVTDANFTSEVLQSEKPVLTDFWAVWCGPCKAIAPIVEQLAAEYESKLKVTKLDVDNNPQTAMQYGVMSIPTLILYKKGQPVERIVGYQNKDALMRRITPHLS